MWLNGRASASQAEGCEFESRHPLHFFAGVAQLAERLIRNQQAGGSSPPASSITIPSGDLAQLVRALRSHRRGRRFESYNPHHLFWGYSAVGAHLLRMQRAGGSNPPISTKKGMETRL